MMVTKSALVATQLQEAQMSKVSRPVFFASLLLALTRGPIAIAQPEGPPAIPPDVRVEQLSNGQLARLVVTWGESDDDCSTVLTIGDGAPTTLHTGPAAATVAVGHDLLLVAYFVEEQGTPLRIRTARREGEVYRLGEPRPIARPAGRAGSPFAVAATQVPDGFAVFFQEVEVNNPSAAHTYLLRLDAQGAPRGPAREVRVPWSLAAAAWNGQGFHLALFYPGGNGGMRLVSLTADGVPEQHPDWSSAAGYIADVHLVASNNRIRAFYRGGRGGGRLLESDVTRIRAWGNEPPRARNHGALGRDQTYVLANRAGGVQPRIISVNF